MEQQIAAPAVGAEADDIDEEQAVQAYVQAAIGQLRRCDEEGAS